LRLVASAGCTSRRILRFRPEYQPPSAFMLSGGVGNDEFESPWLDESFATWPMVLPRQP
jgi:hypothetical protein